MPATENSSFEKMVDKVYGFDIEHQIGELVRNGNLPPDTMLRLSVIGAQATDENGELMRGRVLNETLDWSQQGAQLSLYAEALLLGSPADVMRLNPHPYSREWLNEATSDYNGPVYSKFDLVDAVKARRKAEGKTIDAKDEFLDITRINVRNWTESSIAKSVAHGVWRQLLLRARPEWMSNEGLQQFWTPRVSKTHQGTRLKVELDAQYSVMRRVLVSSALFTDEILIELHNEATTVGVKGVGRVGIQDLGSMLSEQHPTTFKQAN